MKTGGHYWCNDCDEPAFGSCCQKCHQAAQFIPDKVASNTVIQAAQPSPPRRAKINAHDLFQQMHAAVKPQSQS